MHTGQTPYLPQMWGDRPRTKTIFIRVPRTKISKGQVGDKSPQGGELDKVPHPPKNCAQFSGKKKNFFLNFRKRSPVTMISIRQIPPPAPGEVPQKKIKNFTLGGLAPKFDPRPHVPRNLSRALRGAYDPVKNFGDSSNGCRENRV